MQSEDTENGKLETWTPEEVSKAFEAGEIALIDVRTIQEYAFEHIPGALLLPMSFFEADKLPSQQGKPIVFYCGSGVRSEKMARAALAAGEEKIAHMEGGFGGWKKAKLPFIGTEMSTGAPKRIG
ncbi:rhodanese-like domain-containing protein [Rhodobacteraceae bacterium 63075]|nr:rhodanese-like domain-containing protein [Rhodobacteraceae bacterium 63075]